jgi:hypothetical protein
LACNTDASDDLADVEAAGMLLWDLSADSDAAAGEHLSYGLLLLLQLGTSLDDPCQSSLLTDSGPYTAVVWQACSKCAGVCWLHLHLAS